MQLSEGPGRAAYAPSKEETVLSWWPLFETLYHLTPPQNLFLVLEFMLELGAPSFSIPKGFASVHTVLKAGKNSS